VIKLLAATMAICSFFTDFNAPGGGFIDPNKVRFTQNSIGATFKNGNSIDDVARQL